MQLPLLSEEQEKMVRRYGSEHCNEMRLLERGSCTVVAGVLIQPFKTKRVAQSAFNQNLRAWQITPPRYLRGWYRELSFEEYNSEFEGVPRVLGRQLQRAVSYTVGAWLTVANDAVRARDKEAHAKKERGERFLRAVDLKLMREMFDVYAPESSIRRRERLDFRRAELESRRAAEFRVVEAKKKAEADYAERLKCPKFREEVNLARIEEEKRLQAKNVAYHAVEKEKKKAAQLARIAEAKKMQEAQLAMIPEEKKPQEAQLAMIPEEKKPPEEKKLQEAIVAPEPEKEKKKRRIEQIREWP